MNKEILQNALATYGAISQIDMAVEEMAELIQAINKLKRHGLVPKMLAEISTPISQKENEVFFNFCSEIADLEIMLTQLKLMLNSTGQEAVNISIERKLERLQERLNKND